MSLKVIYGMAKTGKTTECFNIIDNIINSSTSKVLYIVPEQYSLQTERNVSAKFSKRAMDRVEVLSFERLAGRVFSMVGPVICDYLDDNAKIMLVEKSIIKCSGKLAYFNKSSETTGFASVVYDAIKTFKKNCITVGMLRDLAENTEQISLKYKLRDLVLLYEEYNKFFNLPYADTDDNLTLLAEKIEKFNLFEDTYIIFDNFMSFTKQQLKVIEVLLKKSLGVIVTLTADDLEYKNKFQLFYKAKLTAKALFELAYDNNVEVMPNQFMSKCYLENDELGFLQNNYFASSRKTYDEKTKNLVVCKSGSYNDEIEQIAAEISRLVREENYRYKDIALLTRSADIYYPIVKDVFERYGIFYNITEPSFTYNNFMYTALMSVFDIMQSNYSFDSVFDFVRSPLCTLDDYDKFLLENYVIEVGNTPKLWTSDDEVSFQGGFSDYDFKRVKSALYFVRECINAFSSKFKGRKKVQDITEAYADFLEYIKAENTVKMLVSEHRTNGDMQSANEISAVYNRVVASINQMTLYFGDTSITFEKFCRILKAGLLDTELDSIPSGVDDVQVTAIDRFQASTAKVVFVAGVTDGVLPCGYINEGILKDSELRELGIEEDVMQKHCDENYVIYRMFCSASEKLYLSYPMADNEGNSVSPSSVLAEIGRIFTNVKQLQNVYLKLNSLEEVEGVTPTFNKVIQNKENGFWSVVAELYKNNKPELYDIITNASKYRNQPKMLFSDVAKKLYGEKINSSISRVECYNRCAFAYFIRYGLNVEERREFHIDPSDYGSFAHEIIEKFSLFADEYGWDKITEELCFEKASEITYSVLKENLSEFYTGSERYTYLFNKIVNTMKTVLWNISQFYQESEYVSLGYEISFADDGEFEPINITLSDGTEVKLRGKIDRADVMRTENGDFVSIVDYKSGAKEIEFEKILCGIQIQLPVYIDAVCRSMSGKGSKTIPAAMLYYHINDPIISGDESMDDEEIAKQIKAKLKMKGIIHEDGGISGAYAVKKDATSSQIEKLCKTAYRQVKNALEKLVSGNISINPVATTNSSACAYCPYGNICNFDPALEDNSYKNYKKLNMEEFFAYVDELDN